MRRSSLRVLTQIILIILISSPKLYSQSDSLPIEHLSLEQGLPNAYVGNIIQDSEGYLWFCTEKGVERYDGYGFRSYMNNPDDTTSFINASATSLYIDREGILWCGSLHGLEKFDRTTNSFTNYLLDHSEKASVSINYIYDILEDNRGIFWVTNGNGVFKFNRISGKFTPANNVDSTYGALADSYHPFVDKDGSLWFGTGRGLDKFDYETGKIVHYWHDPGNRKTGGRSISKYNTSEICEDKNGTMWIGCFNGIIEFNKKSNTFTNYVPDSNIHRPDDVNEVHTLCIGPTGLLWIGTARGIFTFDIKSKKFVHKFINKSIHNYYLGNDWIAKLFFDRSGILWVGTLSHGIYKVRLRRLPYRQYFPGSINRVVKGKDGILWVKRGLEGWVKFDTKTDRITPVDFSKVQGIFSDPVGNLFLWETSTGILTKTENGKITRYSSLKEPIPTASLESSKGMWYGSSHGGLYYFDFKTGKSTEVVRTETNVTALCKDSSGLVWAGTHIGEVICYNPKNKSVSEFVSDPKNASSISGREFFTIYQDGKGRLWFATDGGLDRFVPSTRTFVHFTEKDGLSGNTVYNILEDDHGNLWMGTDKGISKFNPETKEFKNFDVLHGLSSSHHWNRLAVRMDNGEMFIGRSYGLIRFHPDSIKENPYIPPIVITSFMLFDKPVSFGKEIKLAYDKNFLSFEFAALSYYNSQRNQYAYRMEGIDKDWVYSGTRHYASYPDMAPGKYIFRVKGSNNDGIWNEAGTSISIVILSPWWITTWAYISYGVVLILALYGVRRYELNRAALRDKIKLNQAVLKEREETDRVKSRFFANISHEFRTPLTLILGPAEKIISRSSDEDTLKDAGIVKRNSRRLLQLVNQLLDLSRLEEGRLKLEATKGNIVSFTKGIALSFESLSEEKDITLKILSEKEFIELYFDREKMTKILSNILSNAFKFTAQDGKITVAIREGENDVEIRIRDTGIGVPPQELPRLFDRFYQVDSSFTKDHEGVGIGLALTKELVELHHGSIGVESEQGQWTEFTLKLPLGKGHLKDEEIVLDEKSGEPMTGLEEGEYFLQESVKEELTDEMEGVSYKDEKTVILVVEDNYDMRQYIRESVGEDYLIEEAMNGEQGVRKAERIIPDLIITDMMMPKMDGSELTRTLKNDEKTSHIPIIILTAKSGQESKLEGLETGADDYLTKPFDIKELQVRIKNLISLRKKLQERFSKTEFRQPQTGEKKTSSIDEKFMLKVTEVIERHISEEGFSIEDFGEEVGMSRMQVHRKLKALTGKSASRYIRSFRLERARKILSERNENISEVAYSLGFGSPAYFTRCFKEEFGYPPSGLRI
jgi:signal transduction histidine kinase/ligand-binding sensor domain-containing protein/DNA-binding response OmpR family regulator